jgi:hypothetical protein
MANDLIYASLEKKREYWLKIKIWLELMNIQIKHIKMPPK